MSYIGKTPTVGNFIKLDDITTSSTNSYTLQHNSVNFSPESANHMLVSLNGVIQAPNTAFSVSGSTITFLPSSGTLSSSDSIDFIMVYGNVLDVGVATTVSDASITKAKMNLISDSSSAGLTIKGDGGSENGTLQLNCSQNSHGVKLSSPAHSSGQSYELILPTGNVTADKFLKVASVSGSGATGVGQLSFGDAGGLTHYQNFNRTSNQAVNADTDTTITFGNEETGERIGSALVTESSGVFSFSATGYYLVNYFLTGEMQSNGGTSRQAKAFHQTSSNAGSSYSSNTFMATNIADADGGEKDNMFLHNSFLDDVTDTTNNRLKITFRLQSNGIDILGGSTTEFTHIQFIKIAET